MPLCFSSFFLINPTHGSNAPSPLWKTMSSLDRDGRVGRLMQGVSCLFSFTGGPARLKCVGPAAVAAFPFVPPMDPSFPFPISAAHLFSACSLSPSSSCSPPLKRRHCYGACFPLPFPLSAKVREVNSGANPSFPFCGLIYLCLRAAAGIIYLFSPPSRDLPREGPAFFFPPTEKCLLDYSPSAILLIFFFH